MHNMIKVIEKAIEKVIETLKNEVFFNIYEEDLEDDIARDIEWLSDEDTNYPEYIWIVKRTGTELAPLVTSLAKGSIDNIRMHGVDGDAKAYLIKGLTVENGIPTGDLISIENLEKFLKENEKSPSAVTVRIKVYGEMDEVITIPFHKDIYEAAERHSKHAPESIKSVHTLELVY